MTMKKQNENTTQTAPSTGGDETITPEGVTLTDTLTELQAENEQLKTTIRLTEAHRQITGELGRIGARSPELLFDSVKADLQFGTHGQVQNAAALVGELKRRFPEQFGYERPTGSIDAGAGIAAAPQLTKEALAKMNPAEIAALDWAEVRRVLAAG